MIDVFEKFRGNVEGVELSLSRYLWHWDLLDANFKNVKYATHNFYNKYHWQIRWHKRLIILFTINY